MDNKLSSITRTGDYCLPNVQAVLRMNHNQRILKLFSQLTSAAEAVTDRSKEFAVELEINLSVTPLCYQRRRSDKCCWEQISDLLLYQQLGGHFTLNLKISLSKITYGRVRPALLKPPIPSSVLKIWNAASREYNMKVGRKLALANLNDPCYADAYYLDFNFYSQNSARKLLLINYRTLHNDDDSAAPHTQRNGAVQK